MVELPSVLYVGFYWTLKDLQKKSASHTELAFITSIAPSTVGSSPEVSMPEYATRRDFAFQLDSLCVKSDSAVRHTLTLKPREVTSDYRAKDNAIEELCRETTLDRGQATALCENLCRGFAFTQGPPGTGKTYLLDYLLFSHPLTSHSFLGVALTKVLLASRDNVSRRPILIVCTTNHALDSFLKDIQGAGVAKFVRLGGNSKEDWTKAFSLRAARRGLKKTTLERSREAQAHRQVECLITEGVSWCESLNADVLSWPAVRELLKSRYPAILERFVGLERVDSSRLSDIRLARKAGGFAFEFWGTGGDIKDVDRLLEKFSSMLGNEFEFHDNADDDDLRTKYRVLDNIALNAANTAASDPSHGHDVWKLSLEERHRLLHKWKEEIDPQTILDRIAEIHRRHQVAVSRRYDVYHDIDARCLQDRK